MSKQQHCIGDLLYSRNAGYGVITNLREHGVTIYWYNSNRYSADAYHWAETFKNNLVRKLRGEM
jgi:hypothetical protein